MEVGITAFRAELKRWLDQVETGHEVVVTDRGRPIARLCPVDSAPTIERLEREGIVSAPRSPTPRQRAAGRRRVQASGTVSEYVSAHRN